MVVRDAEMQSSLSTGSRVEFDQIGVCYDFDCGDVGAPYLVLLRLSKSVSGLRTFNSLSLH